MKAKTPAKKRPKKPPVTLLPSGTLLAEFTIDARAVPWKASTVTRNGAYKDTNLVIWQQVVAVTAMNARTVDTPYEGPVAVEIELCFAKGNHCDLTNGAKAVEDAMQKIVYVNDRKVRNISTRLGGEKIDRVYVRVTAA